MGGNAGGEVEREGELAIRRARREAARVRARYIVQKEGRCRCGGVAGEA